MQKIDELKNRFLAIQPKNDIEKQIKADLEKCLPNLRLDSFLERVDNYYNMQNCTEEEKETLRESGMNFNLDFPIQYQDGIDFIMQYNLS